MTHEFSNWCSDDDRCDVLVPHPSGVPVLCARPVDHPIHHTAAAPTEQATQPAEVERLKRWQRIAQNWMGVARAQGAKLAAIASEVGENNCWCEDDDVLCVHCRVRAALTAGPPTWPQCGHTDCDCPIEPGRCENCGNQMRDHVQADGLLSCYPRSAVAGVPAAGDGDHE